MGPEEYQHLYEALSKVDGFIYPNDIDLHWGTLIIMYPYITGLVAGAFILASLERVFKVEVLKPTYHIALITALSMLLVAGLPLITHLSQPLRALNILVTPNPSSAMAVFGYVYLWYLLVVLLLELWFDYRKYLVVWARENTGIKKWIYTIFTLGVTDLSPRALKWDKKLGYFITVIGVPSAFILHGYVGFIFGSIKANPWWSTVLMPIIFLLSAMVSGIALVMIIYMVLCYIRKQAIDMKCLDMIARYLFFMLILDFTMESLDQIHRIYEAEESFEILQLLISGKLVLTLFVFQFLLGTLIPLGSLGTLQLYKPSEKIRKIIYFVSGLLVLFGVFFMRWNVVIGGQLFSKSFLGFTSFKLEAVGTEGVLMSIFFLLAPFGIMAVLLWLFPPWQLQKDEM